MSLNQRLNRTGGVKQTLERLWASETKGLNSVYGLKLGVGRFEGLEPMGKNLDWRLDISKI